MLLLFTSIDALKNTKRSSFRTGVEKHDSDVRYSEIAPGKRRRRIAPEMVEEATVASAENAGCNVRSSSSEALRVKPFYPCLQL